MHSNAILFDVDDTLLQFTRDYNDVLADAVRSVEGTAREAWLERFDAAFHDLLADCEPSPYREALAAMGAGADPDDLLEALRDAETEACQPPEDVHSDLAALAGDYQLGVLTNGVPEWQRHKLRSYDLDQYFDTVVTAYDAGAHKPAPEPFALVEETLRAPRYALVGDTDADAVGAQAAGWVGYRYRGDGFGDLPGALGWEEHP
jgi:putative hydrolase of the HAD superfamily